MNHAYAYANAKLYVVATTGIITDAVRVIGGDYVHVDALMGPGVDPHLYRAKESDVHRIASADVVFYNGLHLEGRMASLLDHVGAVAVAHGLDAGDAMQSDFESVFDPHIWHSVPLWQKVVKKISDALIEVDPQNKHNYQYNAQVYNDQLRDLHEYIMNTIKQLKPKKRILVTAHDAFGYFGNTYGFQVVGLQGMSTDAQVSVRDMQHLVDFIVKHKIGAMFLESSVAQRNVRAVQDAVAARGWSIRIGDELFSDALGDAQSGADTYIAMMKHNVHSIVQALS